MKKKIFAALTLALSTVALASCGSNQKLSFNPNWQSGIITELETASAEQLSYAVTYNNAQNFMQGEYYTVEYCGKNNSDPGLYTTTLEYSKDEYTYKTKLEMSVTYTLAGGTQSATFNDVVETEVVFKKTNNTLRPVSSWKKVVSHTPKNVAATKLEEAYVLYEYEFAIDYKNDLSGGTFTTTDNSNPRTLLTKEAYPDGKSVETFEIDSKKYTYLDNEQLLFAFRGLPSSTSGTKTVNVFNASLAKVEAATLAVGESAKTKFSLTIDGESSEPEISYTTYTLKSGNKNDPSVRTLWYANMTDRNNNLYRNVMLRMSVELFYGLGSFTYTLFKADFSK